MQRLSIAAILLFVILSRSGHAGQDVWEDERIWGKLSNSIVTPHIKWANPYVGKRMKVLVIAPCWFQRETVELSQRLEIDYTPFMVSEYEKLFVSRVCSYRIVGKPEASKTLKEILHRDFDLMIVGKIQWSIFPDIFKKMILEKVRNQGTGLVYVTFPKKDKQLNSILEEHKVTDKNGFILPNIPVAKLPAFRNAAPDEIVTLSCYGKGRIALLDYKEPYTRFIDYYSHCLTPRSGYDHSDLWYEYYQALLAKAAIWAANKEPAVYIDKPQVTNKVYKTVFRAFAEQTCDVRLIIRDLGNKIQFQKMEQVVLNKGKTTYSFALPRLKRGPHFIDIWLKAKGKVVNWASSYIMAQSVNAVENIILDKEVYSEGDMIHAKFTLRNSLSSEKLKVELIDNFGRIVNATELIGDGKEFNYTVKLHNVLNIMLCLKASLFDNNGIIAERQKEFSVLRCRENEFSFVMWASAINNDQMSKLRLQQLYAHGIDAVLVDARGNGRTTYEQLKGIAYLVAKCNLRVCPVLAGIHSERQKQGKYGPIRIPCLTESCYQENLQNNCKRAAGIFQKYQPIGYNLGDENYIAKRKEVCFSPTCLQGFREQLKKKYGNIANLNRIWQASYADWDEVVPLLLNDAAKTGNFASWLEHRLYMEKVFTKTHINAIAAVTAIDSDARVGFEGAFPENGCRGYNFYNLFSRFRFFVVYPELKGAHHLDMLSSFMPKNSLRGGWYGSYGMVKGGQAPEHLASFPWYLLLNGANSCWWWINMSKKGTGGYGAYAPDLKPFSFYWNSLCEIREIKKGIGKLLLCSERQTDPIAIHYSVLAKHASTISSKLGEKNAALSDSIDSFVFLLKDAGYQAAFLATEQIEQGILGEGNYKIVILPNSKILTAKEVEQIKSFVAKGGTVIADIPPGTRDIYGRRLSQSALTELFGDFSQEPVVAKYGKGKCIYLGDFFKTYARKRLNSDVSDICCAFARVVKSANCKPALSIMTSNQKPLKATWVSAFNNNGSKYFGVLYFHGPARYGKMRIKRLAPQDVTITFPYRAHIYSIRDNKYYGFTDRIETRLVPAVARIFALLKEPIRQCALTLQQSSYHQGQPVAYRLNLSPAFRSVIRFEVYNQAGTVMRYYSRNIMLNNQGSYAGVIPLALNERPGTYRIKATEVVSGLSSKQCFSVIQ